MGASTRSGTTQTFVKPDWSNGKESNRGRYEVVETPLKTRGTHLLLDSETAAHFDALNPDKSIRNAARMVVMKDIRTGYKRGFIMIFVGSYHYLKTTKNMGRNTYLYREPDFDGSVFFYELDGRFINGWQYKEGKIVASISKSHTGRNDNIATRAIVADCTTYCYTYYDRVCNDYSYWEYDDEWGSTLVVEGYCYDVYEEECYQHCTYYDDGSDDYDDWDYPDPPGSVDPPTKPSTPHLNELYDPGSTLTDEQKQTLENELSELRQLHSTFAKALDDLAAAQVKVKFKFDASLNANAVYKLNERAIYFNNPSAITYTALREEIVHVLQHHLYYQNDMTDASKKYNIELEAKTFIDASKALEYNGFYRSDSSLLTGNASEDFKNTVEALMNSILANNGFTGSEEQMNLYINVANKWNGGGSYTGSYVNSCPPRILTPYIKK